MKKCVYKNSRIIILCGLLLLNSCGQEEKLGLDPTDNIAPAPPTDIQVENTNGGAIISFTAPKDDDLLCVVASYEINGIERTTKVSPYKNKLKVEGFGTTGEYEIFFKSIDKSKNESEKIPVTINPLTPPVDIVFESLKVFNSFGGVKLVWNNETEENIIVEAFVKEGEEWKSIENFYSSSKEGKATIRGYDPEPVDFRFRIRDRWDNYSEFKETENLPLAEFELDKSLFREVTRLPGDAIPLGGYPVMNIWDGNTVNSCFHSTQGAEGGINKTITFDLGVKAKLSRFKMWQRTESHVWLYNHNNLKKYTIYGCNKITEDMYEGGIEDEDGNIYPTFDGWTKIMDVETHKPSGNSGTVTNEDKEYILNGDEQEFPIEAPAFRYIRILMTETYSFGIFTQIGEMSFWGQIEE